MKACRLLVPLVLALANLANLAAGHAADAPGCRDLPDFKRFERSELVACAKKDFAEFILPTGKLESWDYDLKKPNFASKIDLEGRLQQQLYKAPQGPSSAEVYRNYRMDLEGKGFQLLYEARGLEFGPDQGRHFEHSAGFAGQLLGYSPDKARVLAAVREANGTKTYVLVYVVEYADGYHPTIMPQKGQALALVETLQVGDIKDRMTVVSASEIGRALERDGKIAIYGIHFDFNKADIKPESRPSLDEIGRYLRADPQRRLYVVGHTDNVGGFDSNLRLSFARASAVTGELARAYGIDAARLKAAGAGLMAPIATNATEEGRAKNRRVELIAQ